MAYTVHVWDSRQGATSQEFDTLGGAIEETKRVARELLKKEYFSATIAWNPGTAEETLEHLHAQTLISGFRFVGWDGHVVSTRIHLPGGKPWVWPNTA